MRPNRLKRQFSFCFLLYLFTCCKQNNLYNNALFLLLPSFIQIIKVNNILIITNYFSELFFSSNFLLFVGRLESCLVWKVQMAIEM